MGVNSLPKTVTRQRHDCDLNTGPTAPEGGLKTRDWKTRDQIAGVEKAGLKNAGPNFQRGKRTTTVY